MREQIEKRAFSVNRKHRRSKTTCLDKTDMIKDKIRQLNTEEYLDLLPKPKSQIQEKLSTNIIFNLPEFPSFLSDHLVLYPQIISSPFYDRLRGSSAFSTTKFNRQSTNNNLNNNIIGQTTTIVSGGSPRTSHYASLSKRSSRSRAVCDHQQQQHAQVNRPSVLRPTTNTLDSLACFPHVSCFSRIWLFKQMTHISPRENPDEDNRKKNVFIDVEENLIIVENIDDYR